MTSFFDANDSRDEAHAGQWLFQESGPEAEDIEEGGDPAIGQIEIPPSVLHRVARIHIDSEDATRSRLIGRRIQFSISKCARHVMQSIADLDVAMQGLIPEQALENPAYGTIKSAQLVAIADVVKAVEVDDYR